MKVSTFAAAAAVGASGALAQTFKTFTDSNGIEFWQSTWDTTVGKGNAQWGLALPPATETAMTNEYIGHMVVPKVEAGTWMGLSHSSGMTEGLLLVSWLDGEDVKTSFRYATGYTAPDIYTGNATVTLISSSSNATHFEYTYRCQECWSWDQEGATGSQVPATTSAAVQIVGWAQATNPPTTPSDADSGIQQHANDGLFGALVASARNTAYTSWASLATATSTVNAPAATGSSGNSTGTATAVASATAAATSAVACPTENTLANTTWDYIIVGAGAGGIPMADKLSESGASVLLIERGPPSSGRWGGTLKPEWLEGTNLTRFDVPGLDNEIWSNSTGIACEDYSVMAGCVLGGGTAVNAGLWWKANPKDFDYNFPAGWKAADVEPAIERVFDRIPFTTHPSMDGVLYKPCGNTIVGSALQAYGFENITADDEPARKNFTFSFPNHMFSHGERGGPMATYLVTADQRKNFKLIMNTAVDRVVRDGSRITGVETSAFLPGGQCGTVKVTPNTGKVILSAGAFGSPKILFRSGIGPQDQLEVVQGAEGSKMVNSSQWINLPVGYNLDDHTNTDIVIEHPDVSFYDFYGAYDNPIKSDAQKYLDSRSGILAQSAPNLGPFFWQEIVGDDGITRQLQWNGRVESGHDIESNKSMVLSQYLGRGHTSRGRTTITAALDMTVSQVPYLNNKHDLAAVAAGIETVKAVLAEDPRIKIVWGPSANQTTAEFLAAYPRTTGQRSANHWLGSCKMGLDSGLVNNGSAVVDTNAKVYGTDNLFIVDASIFPGMVSTNPSALIVSVAEHASQLIVNLAVGNSSNVATNGTAPYPYGNSTAPQGTGYPSGTAFPTGTGLPIGTAPASSSRCTKEITITRSKPTASASVTTTVSAPVAVATSAESETSPQYPHSSYSRPSGSVVPFPSSQNGTMAYPTATGPTASSGYAAPTASSGAVAQWQRCGGTAYSGPTSCMEGLICKAWNPYYSQCVSADQA